MMGLLRGLVFALIVPLLSACASTSSVDSYVNPAFNRSMFKSVAVMPLTNQRINAGQALTSKEGLHNLRRGAS